MEDLSRFVGRRFGEIVKIVADSSSEAEEPVAAFSKMDQMICEVANDLAQCLRTRRSLKDVETILMDMWKDLCDEQDPEDESKAFVLRPFTSMVDLLLSMIRSDPFHNMSDHVRELIQNPSIIGILKRVQSHDQPIAKEKLCQVIAYGDGGYSPQIFEEDLVALCDAVLLIQSQYGQTTYYELSPAAKVLLINL